MFLTLNKKLFSDFSVLTYFVVKTLRYLTHLPVGLFPMEFVVSPSVVFFFNCILGFGVHVKNMQDCCIGTHMAV